MHSTRMQNPISELVRPGSVRRAESCYWYFFVEWGRQRKSRDFGSRLSAKFLKSLVS